VDNSEWLERKTVHNFVGDRLIKESRHGKMLRGADQETERKKGSTHEPRKVNPLERIPLTSRKGINDGRRV